jgi:hypothetical protein
VELARRVSRDVRGERRGVAAVHAQAQGLWCADLHEPALRVSAVQLGNWSGPSGSTRGQSPFRDDLVVREEQPTVLGFMPLYGRIEVTCRATIGPRSMFSAWMIGLEDEPTGAVRSASSKCSAMRSARTPERPWCSTDAASRRPVALR